MTEPEVAIAQLFIDASKIRLGLVEKRDSLKIIRDNENCLGRLTDSHDRDKQNASTFWRAGVPLLQIGLSRYEDRAGEIEQVTDSTFRRFDEKCTLRRRCSHNLPLYLLSNYLWEKNRYNSDQSRLRLVAFLHTAMRLARFAQQMHWPVPAVSYLASGAVLMEKLRPPEYTQLANSYAALAREVFFVGAGSASPDMYSRGLSRSLQCFQRSDGGQRQEVDFSVPPHFTKWYGLVVNC